MVVFHCSVKLPEGIYCNDWFQTDGDEVLPPPDHQFSQLGVSVFTFPGLSTSGKPGAASKSPSTKKRCWTHSASEKIASGKIKGTSRPCEFSMLGLLAAVTEIAKNGFSISQFTRLRKSQLQTSSSQNT